MSGRRGTVLCLTSSFPRWEGDSTTPFILNLCSDLQGQGWEVHVLAPHAPGAADHEILGGVRVERFRYLWPASLETVCYQGGALINLRHRPWNYAKLPMLVMSELLAVERRLRSRTYDLLHCHWILPQGFVGAISARRWHVPSVLTVHGGDIFGLRGRLLTWFKSVALRRTDAITVNSSVTLDAVRQIAPGMATVRQIPMGATDAPPQQDKVAQLRRSLRRGSGPLLAFVGRLVDEKGVEDLVLAARLLVNRRPDLTVLIVGEGQDRQRFEALASNSGLGDRIYFIGWVPADDVVNYLAAADVFVAPSRTSADGWKEAQGLAIVEAMLANVPVVATRSGGIVDSIHDGSTGLLVDERAPHQIAAAIERLTDDQLLAQRLRSAARARASARFTRASAATAFSDLYAEALGATSLSAQTDVGK